MRLMQLLAIMLSIAAAVAGAEAETPIFGNLFSSSSSLPGHRLVTSGGVTLLEGNALRLEPEMGLGYLSQTIDQTGGNDLVMHKVNAQAGGRVSILDLVHFSAAAKLPVYRYEATSSRGPGPARFNYSRHDYDLLRSGGSLAWTGEVGVHLGVGAELSLFFDQDILSLPASSAPAGSENRFGTRLIFRFK